MVNVKIIYPMYLQGHVLLKPTYESFVMHS